LRAQASTASLIKAFSLLTIAIGVASTLFLSVLRRRAEIGILRSFWIGRAAIVRTFVLQGLLIGAVGPIDPAQGEYLRALTLATAASAIAAILPAWSRVVLESSVRLARIVLPGSSDARVARARSSSDPRR